jgi:hypothetical protein
LEQELQVFLQHFAQAPLPPAAAETGFPGAAEAVATLNPAMRARRAPALIHVFILCDGWVSVVWCGDWAEGEWSPRRSSKRELTAAAEIPPSFSKFIVRCSVTD